MKPNLKIIFISTLQMIVIIGMFFLIGELLNTFIPNRYLQLPFWGIYLGGTFLFLQKKGETNYQKVLLKSVGFVLYSASFMLLKDFPVFFTTFLGISLFGFLYFKAWQHRND